MTKRNGRTFWWRSSGRTRTEDEREVFDLVRIDGMAQAEAAHVLGVSEETVKRRLNRGRRLPAEQLADLRPGEPRPDSI